MTYTYQYTDTPDTADAETFEVEQRITAEALTTHEGRPVRRLISGAAGGFRLVSGASGGWSSTGYSKSEAVRAFEATTGRRSTPRA